MSAFRQVAGLSDRAFKLIARPARQLSPGLTGEPGVWRSSGDDPIFHLDADRFPSRWVLFSIAIGSIEGTLSPSLYVDSGTGFSEQERNFLPQPVDGRIRIMLRLPNDVVGLRFDPMEGPGRFTLGCIAARSLTRVEVAARLAPLILARHARHPGGLGAFGHRLVDAQRSGGLLEVKRVLADDIRPHRKAGDYQAWLAVHGRLSPLESRVIQADIAGMEHRPVFSLIMPTYNSQRRWLTKAIDSVRAQLYPHWELSIADDHSTSEETKATLRAAAASDARIKLTLRTDNGHISRATNTAMERASGDYFVFMDHDDEITPDALYRFARVLNDDTTVDFMYSDEDKIDTRGVRYDPFFKPDWSPEYLECCMYTAHLACYRRDIVRKVGLLRSEFDGAQDYDFTLRYTEHVHNVVHIPRVLYHWRAIEGSTAQSMSNKDYVVDAGTRALDGRLERTGRGGTATPNLYKGCWNTLRNVQGNPLVSIVIPSAGRDGLVRGEALDLLVNCIKSVDTLTTYRNFEFIVVDNGDLRVSTKAALEKYNIQYITYPNGADFNIAVKMNMGARLARGEFLLFMNDDIEASAADWLGAMIAVGQNPGMGVVGAKLHFEDTSLQHVGVTFCNGLPDHIRRLYPEVDPGYNFSSVAQRNYMAVTGACMLVRREIFDRVGGFDTNLAINYNDVDLCLAVYAAGYRVAVSPDAQLFHYESLSRERTVARAEQDYFLAKWGAMTEVDPFYSKWFEAGPPNFELAPV